MAANDFRALQYRFTAHIRDPEHASAPADVHPERMAVYRRLVYNNVESYMARAFSGIRGFYADDDWHALVRGFFVRHHCRRPQFYQAAEEFLEYLQDHGIGPGGGPMPDFLLELAHYEWLKMMLYVAEDPPAGPAIDPDGDLLAGVPVLSPLVYNLAYRYPVHEIVTGEVPAQPAEPTLLVAYREPHGDEEVRFLQVNAVTAGLLQMMEERPSESGRALLLRLAETMGHPEPGTVIRAGGKTLADLRRRGILLGVLPAS